ncbi:efflux RND transporter periplasmic adaptor subunit [Desulfosarcina sp.]|uniref:efflux RND transporter periplasmic adaptor subunit n=1 Tax=Desulfosarcina sp. TaxID=2027861 RepID=UPI0029BEF98C|nr:efflux RND transporter periplasmic adaptor subunit [Desulfosarcina sp.]MDX2454218.1 efflux RND transporter periplasmic adaptor subunit [Desulfosarcina sp.]MDX2491890.1 efflux RND transporter periplasmic adaptor subunit [Desulfosarcina sp.]
MRFKIIGLIACLSLYLFACSEKQATQAPPPPPEVSVVETQAQDVPLFLEFVGQTAGLKDIAIRARVEGFLEGLHFQEGGEVKKGDLLYTLESQPFEEKVSARMSAVAEVKTMLAKTKGDLDRIKPLAEINAVSKSDLDEAMAAYEATQSSLEAAKATLRATKIELSYTKIDSPIDGIIGKSQAKVGDFVGREPNPVILTTVSQVDTILVTFFITETQYLELARNLAGVDPDKMDEQKPSLELILIDGSVYTHKGQPDFVDREVDTTTGAMLVQASFPNPEKLLRPGQFARVRIRGQVVKDGILIPQRCVMELQGLHNVYVVDASNKAEIREITVGPKVGSNWLVTKGLKPGEKVVYEGLQKVKDGIDVKPTMADLNPKDA